MASNRTDTQAVVNLVINGKQAMTSLKELTDTQRKLNTELRNMKPSDLGYKERLKEVQMVNKALHEQQLEIKGVNNESSKFKTTWKDIAGGIVGGFGIQQGISFITEGITKMKDAYAEAEKNRAVLTNAFQGDAKKAGESLKMLMDFAAKTPFGLQEATDGYLKLVNRGITPAREEMVKLGDVAASQGKSMDQYIEAILDAQTGENERLKELGIRATKNGDMVSFSFKGITKEVKNTEDAIYKALIGFGEMNGVAGTMDVVSKTIVGFQSNISDTWDQIFTKMGQSSEGFIKGFYSTYSSLLEFINEDLLSTQTNAQKLTKEFQEQAEKVNNLEHNIEPLLSRYDELKSKGKLNKDEQTELRDILEKVSNTIPGAITNWNKLGEAMDMNTGKAREFIEIQKVLLKTQNKDALVEAKKELAEYSKLQKFYQDQINRGTVTVNYQAGGSETKKLTEEGIQYTRAQLKKYAELVKERELLIKGLSGDYMDEITKRPPPAVTATSTARTEGVIAKEIAALKDLRKEVDINSKEYAEYTAKIKKLEAEQATALGKSTPGSKSAESAKKQAIKEFEKLDEAYKKLELQRLDDQLSSNQKEVEQEGRKYDELIKKEQEFLNMKGATPEQKKETQANILKIEADKEKAVQELRVRQEADMVQKIKDLNVQLSGVHEGELQKQKNQINKFYDDLEKKNSGDTEAIARLRIAREKELNDAVLRAKQQLQKDSEKIETTADPTTEKEKLNKKLADIEHSYDAEIEALKSKYEAQLDLTEQFEDAMAKIKGEIRAKQDAVILEYNKEKSSREFTEAINAAETVSSATFQIIANNRRAESEQKISLLEKERDSELENKNLTERQKDAINKKYNEKIKAEKLRAWKAEQAASLAQAVVNGALAVSKVIAQTGILSPFAIPAVALATAAQIGVILSQKPPEFAKGVRDFPGGPAIVGEAGPELVDENGSLWLAKAATLADLESGSNVYTSTETSNILRRKSLGEELYPPISYSTDTEKIRNAERLYRSGYTSDFSQNASRTNPTSNNTQTVVSINNEGLEKKLDQVIEAIGQGFVFDYKGFEDFKAKIDNARNSQSG
jgi:hypothetical protein